MIDDSQQIFRHLLKCTRRFLKGTIPALLATMLPLTAMAETALPSPDMVIRAQLVAVHHPVISSTIAGRIDYLKQQAGDFFKKGETLVRIDCTAQQSELVLARTILARKEKILHINNRLNQLGSVSELEMAVSESEVKEARAGVTFHEAVVNQCTIRAPFSGRVVRKFVNRYQYVSEGEPIFEVIDHRKLEIEMIVPSIWLRWLKKGHPFEVEMDETGETCSAEISRITGKVDPVSHSIKVFGRLEQPSATLMPGMSGRVHIIPPEAAPQASTDE